MGLFHPSCTIKMGAKDCETACLDTSLKVCGLRGLRVADLSVPPELPRYNLPLSLWIYLANSKQWP
jgi:choline dehydrogenase